MVARILIRLAVCVSEHWSITFQLCEFKQDPFSLNLNFLICKVKITVV